MTNMTIIILSLLVFALFVVTGMALQEKFFGHYLPTGLTLWA